MDNFTFYSPTYFAFGKESEKQAGDKAVFKKSVDGLDK